MHYQMSLLQLNRINWMAAFFKHNGKPYEWSEALIEPWPTRRWLCVTLLWYWTMKSAAIHCSYF